MAAQGNPDGSNIWGGVKGWARVTGYSRATIFRLIADLENPLLGFLSTTAEPSRWDLPPVRKLDVAAIRARAAALDGPVSDSTPKHANLRLWGSQIEGEGSQIEREGSQIERKTCEPETRPSLTVLKTVYVTGNMTGSTRQQGMTCGLADEEMKYRDWEGWDNLARIWREYHGTAAECPPVPSGERFVDARNRWDNLIENHREEGLLEGAFERWTMDMARQGNTEPFPLTKFLPVAAKYMRKVRPLKTAGVKEKLAARLQAEALEQSRTDPAHQWKEPKVEPLPSPDDF